MQRLRLHLKQKKTKIASILMDSIELAQLVNT